MPELQKLELVNLRNHAALTVELSPVTVITGANGSGKTAILEAISYISVADSWKVERDAEVISFDQPFTRIVAGEREVIIQRSPALKRYRIDGVSKRLGDVLGQIPSVLFQPDDSQLVQGSPGYRRKALDRLLSQTIPGYAKQLQHLQKVVKQRNQLLKRIAEGVAEEGELQYWDGELAGTGTQVQAARAAAMAELGPRIAVAYQELVPEGEGIQITYEQSPIQGLSLEHLQTNRYKEVASGITLYGPHREDLQIMCGEHAAEHCLSRGQTRAMVLAWKVAELAYVQEKTEQEPTLLLDDVFAEFDAVRRERVLQLVGKYTSVLAVTDLAGLEGRLPTGASQISL